MAEKTLTAFTINSLLIGVLLMGLLSSYILLVNNEGRGEIFDDFPIIESLNLNLTNSYTDGQILETTNINSNLSAQYNPELAISAADQSGNAIAINLQDLMKVIWALLIVLGTLLFGNVFTTLSTLIISVVGIVIVAYFIKGIRTGSI